ncbi:MAG TPA: M14 family metallopeptidase [Pyrinomonadaceae bacterium]|nr:M14 family metallopeptidase [Pyrinomonadaceae bacterium]
MKIFPNISASLRLCGFIALFAFSSFAQNVPTPKDVLGFTPGDDRKLVSWNQFLTYFQKLEDTSPRVKFEAIGKTTMDRPFVFATISSPENLKNLEKYKQINAKLANPRLIKSNDALAKQLIKEGKTIVLITCGIHSTEVGGNLASILIADKLATSNDPEVLKILENTIILLVPSLNPDGNDIVKNWYDKTLGTPYEGTSPPELYHKYTGHDNNRDWYAFSQVETQMTVDKIHNVWHPQIVNDIHQQGANGSRIFIPPYMQPVEPNVPKELVEGYTELGNFMADEMRKEGFQGITTNSTYDAWTPARAYSHYHGGVRILTETASAKLATPINVTFEQLRDGLGYDAKKESDNFKPLWKGGEWHLRDITNYMTAATFQLLKHASANREKWLSRFYAIGKEAVRPRKNGELFAYIIPPSGAYYNRSQLTYILSRAGVEIDSALPFTADGVKYPEGTQIIKLSQPYGSFAKALLEKQVYPNLLDEKGNPIQPYDVTAQTLPLLMNVEVKQILKPFQYQQPTNGHGSVGGCGMDHTPTYAIYRSYVPSMDEGWTRWVYETAGNQFLCGQKYESIVNSQITKSEIKKYQTIIFPDQSPNQMLNGHAKGSMPDEYVGGIGKDGVANLRKFVEDGGTLVFLNRASDFAIQQFGLPLRDVTDGLKRKDFFIPGSILRTELETNHPIAKGMPKQSIAWFEDSSAFELTTSDDTNVQFIAKYPDNPKDILLSGWALGAEKIAGKAALVQVNVGKGKMILFGFRPQYRGQSLATFPLFFNAIVR